MALLDIESAFLDLVIGFSPKGYTPRQPFSPGIDKKIACRPGKTRRPFLQITVSFREIRTFPRPINLLILF
jgi:hypothetical protein